MMYLLYMLNINVLYFKDTVHCLLEAYFELQSMRQLATFASDKNGKRVAGCRPYRKRCFFPYITFGIKLLKYNIYEKE